MLPAAPQGNRLDLRLLKAVSRSFFITLRLLPGAVRPQIGLAYLLARMTDTVADTSLVPAHERLTLLRQLRARLLGESHAAVVLRELLPHQGNPAERVLLERAEEALALLAHLTPDDLRRVRKVLDVITTGQILDLERFGTPGPGQIPALHTPGDLDDYTYRVAGCVGEFWTATCRAHLFPQATLDEPALLRDAVRFGKGLQLVNVLRDLPADLRQGRCYIPSTSLTALGLTPADLLKPENEARFRPLYDEWLRTALGHLLAGWDYTSQLPWSQVRVRLSCALPVLIGIQTLEQLRCQPILGRSRPIKIPRSAVRRILWASVVRYPIGPWWRSLATEVRSW